MQSNRRAPRKGHTFLSLVANKACEAFGAEAVEEEVVLVQQAGPTIQALAGITEVTCSNGNKQVLHSVDIWGGRATTKYVLGPQKREESGAVLQEAMGKGRTSQRE